MISVWSRWQDKYYRLFLKKLLFNFNKEEFGDIEIYWKKDNINIPRFYHLYSKRELVQDIKAANLRVIDFYDEKITSKKFFDNYFVVVKP